MVGRLTVACVLITAPAFAQSRVYTNADLGKPRTWSHTATAEDLASLAARQFVAPPVFPDSPTVLLIQGDPSHGPFGPLEITPAQPLDPNWQNNAWYGPGYIGGWYGSRLPERRDGFLKDGVGVRPRFPSEHNPGIPPPGQGQRPVPPSTAGPNRQPPSRGNAGGLTPRAVRR
jgi:hypothetical protein